jgi:hypothetical protein
VLDDEFLIALDIQQILDSPAQRTLHVWRVPQKPSRRYATSRNSILPYSM